MTIEKDTEFLRMALEYFRQLDAIEKTAERAALAGFQHHAVDRLLEPMRCFNAHLRDDLMEYALEKREPK